MSSSSSSLDQLTQGTLSDLMEQIERATALDGFTEAFVAMNSYFCSLDELLAAAESALLKQPEKAVRLAKYFNFLKKLIKSASSYNFQEEGDVAARFRALFKRISEHNEQLARWSSTMSSAIDQLERNEHEQHKNNGSGSGANDLPWLLSYLDVKKGGTSLCQKLTLADASADVRNLARQITLIDHALLSRIGLAELMRKAPAKRERSPRLHEFIDNFNALSYFVVSDVLQTIQLKERAALIGRAVELATELRALNNFSSSIAVVSALHCTPVSRLRATWKQLSKHCRDQWDAISDSADPEGNYASYRRAVAAVQPPLVPHVCCIAKDLTSIEEMPSMIGAAGGGVVNWSKMRHMGNLLVRFALAQQTMFRFDAHGVTVERLARSLNNLMGESEQYRISRLLEPPAATGATNAAAADSAPIAIVDTTSGGSGGGDDGSGSVDDDHKQLSSSSPAAAARGASSRGLSVDATGILNSLAASAFVSQCVECDDWQDRVDRQEAKLGEARHSLIELHQRELVQAETIHAVTATSRESGSGDDDDDDDDTLLATKASLLEFMKQKKDMRASIQSNEDSIETLRRQQEEIEAEKVELQQRLLADLVALRDLAAKLANVDTQHGNTSLEQIKQLSAVLEQRLLALGQS
jgi:RasGEF domain